MKKLKIGFEIISTWDYEAFRDVIQYLIHGKIVQKGKDGETYEILASEKYIVYLITKSTDTTFIDLNVAKYRIDTNNVFQVADNNSVILALNTNLIDIYLTPEEEVKELVNNTSATTTGILVNTQIQDIYNINPKWFVQLRFWIDRLSKINEEENC